MKFSIKNPGGNVINLMRRVGYIFQGQDQKTLEQIFSRPLERAGFPRFHLYLKENKETGEMIFNLHLDQKRPIYKGVPAHAGEYEGGVVEREAERIKQTLSI